ncbi:MAG: diguanylate cyclase [Desulfosarcinaceae bacterium]|jgi:diguanylate cyclase (GGDEF)-like protein
MLLTEIEALRREVAELRQFEQRCQTAEASLAALEERNRLIGDSTPLGIFTADVCGEITGINRKMVEMFSRLSVDAAEGMNLFQCRALAASGIVLGIRRCIAEKKSVTADHPYEGPLAFRMHWCHHLSPIIENDGALSGVMAIVEDCTNLNRAEAALRESETRYRQLFQSAPIALIEWDVSALKVYLERIEKEGVTDLNSFLRENPHQVHYCWDLIKTVDYNQAFLELMGLSDDDRFNGAFIPTDSEFFLKMAHKVILTAANGRISEEAETTLVTTTSAVKTVLGKSLAVPGHEVTLGRVMIALLDISQRKAAEAALRDSERRFREQAIRDGLTGLYNQRYLYQSLAEWILRAGEEGLPISLIFIDLDHFKQVVDTHGHLNGSRAIRQVARTIDSCLQAPAYAVAYAGDEFVVVLPEWDRPRAFEKAAEIREQVKRTRYVLDSNVEIRLKASLGVATFPQDAGDLNELIAMADKALFTVKAGGKDAVGRIGAL